MRTFSDTAGRTWTVAVNVDAVKRVKTLTGVDLLATDQKLFEMLATDLVLLCDVVYAICKPEADARNVSSEDFGRAMSGDALGAATNALVEELVDFFPQRRRREVTRKAVTKLSRMLDMAFEAAEERLDSGELERELRAALAENRSTFGNSFTSSPVSPESTPAR